MQLSLENEEDMNLWSWNYITDLIQIKAADSFTGPVALTFSTLNTLVE